MKSHFRAGLYCAVCVLAALIGASRNYAVFPTYCALLQCYGLGTMAQSSGFDQDDEPACNVAGCANCTMNAGYYYMWCNPGLPGESCTFTGKQNYCWGMCPDNMTGCIWCYRMCTTVQ
jgi:hypothetical protein